MKVKNIVRKAVALGAGTTLVATSIAGAFAYDLSTYPAKYIVDGKFDGKIVVGEKAATADVLGSIDIAASLQGASVSKVPVPGQAGTVSLSGDSFRIESSNDRLELRESLGNVTDTITETNLAGLKSGRISTSVGTTDFHQYLRLQDQGTLQDMAVNYVRDPDSDKIADYLVVDTSKPFLEWELQFPSGLESKTTQIGTSSTFELKDMEDRTINMMGTDYNIVKATVTTANTVSMTLMGGSVPDTLREGETKTYTINGVDYEVTLVFVSDPASTGTPEVKFSVNGELTQALSAGETDTLSGGLQIGVRDILVNPREGVASFFLGANKIEFTDNAADNTWTTGSAAIKINNKAISDGQLNVLGQFTDNAQTQYKITSIKYQLTMDAAHGGIAYVPAGQGLRALMRRPESLVSPSFDLKYAGLEQVKTTPFALKASGNDRYQLSFTNIEGQAYNVPFVSNRNGNWKFGSDVDNLIMVEPSNATYASAFNINRNDYFVVSNYRGDADKSVTNVLRYISYDPTSSTVTLRDISTDSESQVAVTPSNTYSTGNTTLEGVGNLIIGGHTYNLYVNDTASKTPAIAVDLNGNNAIDATSYVPLTAWGGVVNSIVRIGSNTTGASMVASSGDAINNVSAEVVMNLTVLKKNFDSNAGDEGTLYEVVPNNANGNRVTMNFLDYNGPRSSLNGGQTDVFKFDYTNPGDVSDRKVGMTDWGILIQEYDPTSNSPNEITFAVPEHQVYAQVFATMGDVTATQGGAGSADKVNPIAVGLAVLDKDAPAIGSENLIVVGGPCANTVAASLLNNPAKCGEGFEPGKAMIRSFEKNGKVAILVAGYEATETLGASRVLAAYKDYNLKGTEVEVVVADLNDISVKAAGTTNTTQ